MVVWRVRLVFAFLLLISSIEGAASHGHQQNRNPYKVLGAKKDATQKELRQRYRELCLKYHPDKNVHKGAHERERSEAKFKEVQMAYSQVGDEDSRRRYDATSSFPSSFSSGTSEAEAMDAFFRSFAGQTHSTSYARFPSGDLFGRRSSFMSRQPSFWNAGGSLKSVYVQKVKVPLKDLFAGRSNTSFTVSDSVWQRYRAGFRGGAAYLVLYQSVLFASPLLRTSRLLSMVLGLVLFHVNLPRPKTRVYTANILPGYKGGTTFLFKDAEPGFDMTFVLEEEEHGSFSRAGDDICTSVAITKDEAKKGCNIRLTCANDFDLPTFIELAPGRIRRTGDSVVVKNMGWPKRNAKDGQRGNLIVTFNIVKKKAKSGKRKIRNRVN